MPTAPRYDSPQVQPQSLPSVRVQGDAPLANFGGGESANALGQTIRGVSNDFMAIVQKEKQKADDTATKDALNQTVKLSNDLMYDPKNGAVNKQGKDAFGVIDDYTSQYDQGTDQIYNNLKNQDQRDAYKMMKAQYRNSLEESLQKHVRTESVKFEDQTFRSLIATNQDDAVLNFRDPDRIAQSLNVQRKAIESHADQNGWDEDQKKLALSEASSKTHAGVIDQYLALGQDMAAKKYFDANREQINGAYRTELDKKLEEGSIKGEAQRTTDKLFVKHDDLMGALAETKKIDDIKLRDETERRLEHAYAVKKSAQQEQQTQAYQNISKLVDQTTDLNTIHASPEWTQLSIPEKNAVDSYAMDRVSGKNTQTDRSTYHELNQLASDNRAKFLDINLSSPEYKFKLSEGDFKKFDDMQREAKSGNTEKLDGFESDQDVVNSTLFQAGLDPKSKGDKQKRYQSVKESIDKAVEAQAKATGKKLTNDDIRAIAKKQTVQVITDKGWFSNTKKYVGELNLSKMDRAALEWASDPANANDNRAAAIKKRLKVDDGI